jgi:hypothetical protein
MKTLLANADVGRKNILFGIVLFLVLGVLVGLPLTIDLFGGSTLTNDQYQTWKVVHGYGVFLSFINYFFGLLIDRLRLTTQEKEIASWSFLIAGLIGGATRMILVLASALDQFGIYTSLGESICFVLGTFIFVRGQLKEKASSLPEHSTQTRYSGAR